jgi:LmbE family N-acetylglucosaminyl deacetylase
MPIMNLKFHHPAADLFIPDGQPLPGALSRTTHLAIGAHQDDLEIMAWHGILACFGQTDRWFTGVVVTDGAGSSRSGVYADYTDKAMQVVRSVEQRKAATIGEYAAQIQLAHPSAAVKNPACPNVVDDLEQILRATQPRVVYLHNPADKHDTHVGTALRAIAALRRMPEADRPEAVYGCEVWRDLDWLGDDEKQALPVGGHSNLAAALLGVFDSQICGGKRYDLAAVGRRLANATFFASHAVDETDALTYAMDLTPLIRDPGLDIAEYTLAAVDRFRADVADRVAKLT